MMVTRASHTSESNDDMPLSKRAKQEEEVESVFLTLHEKHANQFSDPQLRLWARMQVNGLHNDLENPPNVPAITGQPIKKKNDRAQQPLTDALAGAATAITKALLGSQSSTPIKPSHSATSTATEISPASKANLSGQYLHQLGTLQQLRENGVLSSDEFAEQKKLLLGNLRGLNS